MTRVRSLFVVIALTSYCALPVLAHAMYVPEIRANGAEVRVKVEDAIP